MAIKRHLIANFAGQGWVAFVGLAFVPVYLNRLGVEAYGLIGFYAVLQAWLSLLDLGITPTVTREAARLSTGYHSPETINDLVRSLEIAVFSIAAALACALWLASEPIAAHWVTSQSMAVSTVAEVVAVMAFVVALRFCEGIYRGALYGLERQVFYNSVYALLSTVRFAGAAALVIVIPSIKVFFWWQAGLSLVTIIVLAGGTHSALPRANRRPRFSPAALRKVRAFAAGMTVTAVFALAFTQIDKLMLSRLVDLESFGRYMLAVALGGVFPMLAGPVASAYFPKLTAAVGAEDIETSRRLFRAGTQIVAVFIAPVLSVCVLVGREVLLAWTGNPVLAAEIAPILRWIAIGAFCNAALQIPFMLQLAHGWTTISVWINVLGTILLGPAVYIGVIWFGPAGAAAAWAATNAIVLTLGTTAMHRRLLPNEAIGFVRDALLLPLAASLLAVGAIILVIRDRPDGRFESLGVVVASSALALVAAALTMPICRRHLSDVFHRRRLSRDFKGEKSQ